MPLAIFNDVYVPVLCIVPWKDCLGVEKLMLSVTAKLIM